MQLKMEAETPLVNADLNGAVQEIVNVYLQKLAEDSPEVYAQLQYSSESLIISRVQVDFQFLLDGQSEPQYLTTDVRGTGHPEMLVVTAKLDENGNVDFSSVADNDEQSMFSDVEALIAEGLPTEFTAIESNYYSDQLQEIDSVAVSGMDIVIYLSAGNQPVIVVQYIAENKLIQEIELPYSDETLEKVVQYYKQLI